MKRIASLVASLLITAAWVYFIISLYIGHVITDGEVKAIFAAMAIGGTIAIIIGGEEKVF